MLYLVLILVRAYHPFMSDYTEDKKPLRRRGGKTKPVGQHIEKLTKRAFGKRGFAGGTIISQWDKVVGKELAALSVPVRITYPKGKRSGGTLYLRIASGSIALELQHMETILIDRINTHFGYRSVERVQLQQAPLPDYGEDGSEIYKEELPPLTPQSQNDLDNSLSHIEDPELHAALERLGENIMRRKKN